MTRLNMLKASVRSFISSFAPFFVATMYDKDDLGGVESLHLTKAGAKASAMSYKAEAYGFNFAVISRKGDIVFTTEE